MTGPRTCRVQYMVDLGSKSQDLNGDDRRRPKLVSCWAAYPSGRVNISAVYVYETQVSCSLTLGQCLASHDLVMMHNSLLFMFGLIHFPESNNFHT